MAPPDPDLTSVVSAFCGEECNKSAVGKLGSGNINDTYLVETGSQKIVLQKISSFVFPYPLRIIKNFEHVTRHLSKIKSAEKLELEFAKPLYTAAGELYHRDESGSYWRGQTYLQHFFVKSIKTKKTAFSIGQTLGVFHKSLENFDLAKLQNPLPGFHKTSLYLEEIDKQIAKSTKEFNEDEELCLQNIESYRGRAGVLEQLLAEGILFEQPVHGDPKIDNFIFNDSQEATGLLDLDTVSRGLIHHDLGDCLRSCCNLKGEKGSVEEISFDLTLCSILLQGYLNTVGEMVSKKQRTYIYEGLFIICYELGLRFFTDHLKGNSYFKVEHEGENLLRAINQFHLVKDILKKETEIRNAIG